MVRLAKALTMISADVGDLEETFKQDIRAVVFQSLEAHYPPALASKIARGLKAEIDTAARQLAKAAEVQAYQVSVSTGKTPKPPRRGFR